MKVLILHASVGAGHMRAAQALENAFESDRARHGVLVLDILDYTPPLFRRTCAKGYLDLVRRAPELWGFMYAHTDRLQTSPYLLESGAALRIFEPADAPYKVETILADRKRMARMQRQARAIGRPFAARDIVRDILRRMQ